jgi:hypothetical protein
MSMTCNSCLDFNCDGDCFTTDEPTRKVFVDVVKPFNDITFTGVLVVGERLLRQKCSYCFRVTECTCSQCGLPVCPQHVWSTRTPGYGTPIDLCRQCRDSAVAETNNG